MTMKKNRALDMLAQVRKIAEIARRNLDFTLFGDAVRAETCLGTLTLPDMDMQSTHFVYTVNEDDSDAGAYYVEWHKLGEDPSEMVDGFRTEDAAMLYMFKAVVENETENR